MTDTTDVLTRPLEQRDIPACAAILRGLPEWFDIPEAVARYIDDLGSLPDFVAVAGGDIVGFLALRHHNSQASEIHVMAVRRDHHRRGAGRALVEQAVAECVRRGVRLLQVKTLGPSHPDPGYAKTRAFYEAMGFIPLEETAVFWGESQPTLIMVRPLGEGRSTGNAH